MKANGKKSIEYCVNRLRVVAEHTRFGVLALLQSGPKRVGELREALQVEERLLSHHLRVMREEGFVETTRQGRSILYRISRKAMGKTKNAFQLGFGVLLLNHVQV